MFIALRKSIIVYLVILQLVAPLVHAHTKAVSQDLGLHVPGLELYAPDHSRVSIEATNYQTHEHGLLVGIDTGLKLTTLFLDDNNDAVFEQKFIVPQPELLCYEINFSPQTRQLIPIVFLRSLSPRAPPALVLL